MQQILNARKQLLAQTSWKEGWKKSQNWKSCDIDDFWTFFEAPLHILRVSPKHIHQRNRMDRSILTDLLPLYIICHIVPTHIKKVDTNLCHQLPTAMFPHFSLSSIYCGYPDVLQAHQGWWAMRILGNKILWIQTSLVTVCNMETELET